MSTVAVTGADRNIGLEICREFLKRGWEVYGGKYAVGLTLMENLAQEYPDQMKIIPLDCSSLESVQSAAHAIKNQSGRLDMVVHNAAGFGSRGSSDIRGDFDFSAFYEPYNINALGAMRLVQCFSPLMREGLRRFCFISSEAGAVAVSHRDGLSGVSSYCMSKTALNMAIRLMFNDLQPKGYSFRVFHPGWVRSPKLERDGQVSPFYGGKFDPWETARAAVPQFIEDRDWEDRLVMLDNEGAAWPF